LDVGSGGGGGGTPFFNIGGGGGIPFIGGGGGGGGGAPVFGSGGGGGGGIADDKLAVTTGLMGVLFCTLSQTTSLPSTSKYAFTKSAKTINCCALSNNSCSVAPESPLISFNFSAKVIFLVIEPPGNNSLLNSIFAIFYRNLLYI